MFETYKPSGRFGVMVIPMLLVAMAIAAGLAFVYQYLLDWIPIIYITVLVTVGAGFALSMIGTFVCSMGHCRNRMLAFLVGLLLAVTFLGGKFWFQYQSSIPTREGLVEAILASDEFPGDRADAEKIADTINPADYTFMDHIKDRVDTGWRIGKVGRDGGGPVSGTFVYIIWLIEAGIVLFFALIGPMSQARSPYSEKMSTWANEEEQVMTLPISDQEMVTQIQQATSVEQLLEIPIPQTDQSNIFAVYKTNSIPGQELEDAYLSVELLELSLNNKGEQEKKETPLVTHAILSSEKRKQLVENASLLQEALADFRQAVNEDAVDEDQAEEV